MSRKQTEQSLDALSRQASELSSELKQDIKLDSTAELLQTHPSMYAGAVIAEYLIALLNKQLHDFDSSPGLSRSSFIQCTANFVMCCMDQSVRNLGGEDAESKDDRLREFIQKLKPIISQYTGVPVEFNDNDEDADEDE